MSTTMVNLTPSGGTPITSATDPPLRQAWNKGWIWMVLILILMVALGFWSYNSGKDLAVGKQDLDFVVLTAPFVALAAILERFWEALFDWYERFALSTARVVGVTATGTAWMTQEISNAEKTIATLVNKLGATSPDSTEYTKLSAEFAKAENRLTDAKDRIVDLLKSAQYVAVKRAIIVFGSLVLGVVISVASSLTLLNTIGFHVPAPIDMIVTGLLIGSGPGPMHAFIGTILELRNSVASLADSVKGGAIKKVAEGLQQVSGTVNNLDSTSSTGSPANNLNGAGNPPALPSSNGTQPQPRDNTGSVAENELALNRQLTRLLKSH